MLFHSEVRLQKSSSFKRDSTNVWKTIHSTFLISFCYSMLQYFVIVCLWYWMDLYLQTVDSQEERTVVTSTSLFVTNFYKYFCVTSFMHWDTFQIQILYCSQFCWIFLLLEKKNFWTLVFSYARVYNCGTENIQFT